MIKACLFDMDGLLLNTEDLYTETTNEVLAEHGKGPLPWDVKINLQGRPGTDAAKHFLDWAQLPYTPEELFAKTSKIQETKWPRAAFMPGALELLQFLDENDIPFALATSSHTLNYQRKTDHLRHGFDLFRHHFVTGDDERVPAGRGKPHPDIWHAALESLNKEQKAAGKPLIEPHECLVFEDAVPGVRSGVASGATVIWVPHPEAMKVLGREEADRIIGGHGEILTSLEQFDRAKYGLVKQK